MTQKNSTNTKHSCVFCNRQFNDELILLNHKCEKKRRWHDRESAESRLAFLIWLRFYELNSFTIQTEKKTFKEFMNTKYYTSFIKFAKHIINLNVIDTNSFIDYIIKSNLPLNKWTNNQVYETYISSLLKNEQPENALARNIEFMQNWSNITNNNWFDFFRKVNTNQAIIWIQTGRISPWVLFNSESSDLLLNRCNSEQVEIIDKYINYKIWKIKFAREKETTEWIRSTLKQAGL
jgi:hypothetical protein